MALEYPREMFARLAADGAIEWSAENLDGLTRLVDTLFFASLMFEEGDPVRVAIVHHPDGASGLETVTDESPGSEEDPELAWDVSGIPQQPFDAPTLAKMSRGVAYGSQLIVVGGHEKYRIDGIARRRRRTDGGSVVRIAAPRPGAIVLESHFEQLLRYEAGQQKPLSFDVVGRTGPIRRAIASINGETMSSESSYPGGHTFYSYPELAVHRLVQRMRATGSGAILAMLSREPKAESELRAAVRFGRTDPHALTKRIEIDMQRRGKWFGMRIRTHGENLNSEQVHARDAAENAADLAREELEAAIEDVAQLSAIDGAVLAGPKLAIYGAGCVLPSSQLEPRIVRRALDISGEQTEPYPNLHGARHRAGFWFAYSNPDTVAFVVSEDGPVSCAHRVGDHVLVWSVEVLET